MSEKKEKIEVKKEDKEWFLKRRHHPLSIFRELDRIRDDFVWNFGAFPTLNIFDTDKFFQTPLSNVSEEKNCYSIESKLPGLEKTDLEITVNDGVLEVKGEQKDETEEKKRGYIRREYSESSYYRRFRIPDNVDEDKIDATLDKGILKLILPKKEVEEKEEKKIEIK